MSNAVRPRQIAELFLLAFIWSFSFVAMKLAVATVPPTTVTAARLILAAALLYPLIRLRGYSLPTTRAAWTSFFAVGLLGNMLPFILITGGLGHIDSSAGAILMAVMPLATIALAHWFAEGERLNGTRLIGVGFGFLGILVLVGPAALAGLGTDLAAELVVVTGALCFAAAAVLARRMPRMPASVGGAGVMVAAAVVGLPVALVVDRPWTLDPSAISVAMVLWLGVFPTAIGSLLYFRLVAGAGAGFLAMTNYLVPVLGALWGAVFLAERIAVTDIAALLLILTGIGFAGRGAPGRVPIPRPERSG